jgi:hypothetical protein
VGVVAFTGSGSNGGSAAARAPRILPNLVQQCSSFSVYASPVVGFDWPGFWAAMDGYPFSKLEWLAWEADVDPDWLHGWLTREVELRSRERAARHAGAWDQLDKRLERAVADDGDEAA